MKDIPWLITKDFYQVLTVDSSATGEQIRTVYYELMQDQEVPKSEKKKITCCYRILGDKIKRDIYDNHGIPGIFIAETQGLHSYHIYNTYVFSPLYCSGPCQCLGVLLQTFLFVLITLFTAFWFFCYCCFCFCCCNFCCGHFSPSDDDFEELRQNLNNLKDAKIDDPKQRGDFIVIVDSMDENDPLIENDPDQRNNDDSV